VVVILLVLRLVCKVAMLAIAVRLAQALAVPHARRLVQMLVLPRPVVDSVVLLLAEVHVAKATLVEAQRVLQ